MVLSCVVMNWNLGLKVHTPMHIYIIIIVTDHLISEEAKKFEDGLQEAKDFFNIQRKHVCVCVCVRVCSHACVSFSCFALQLPWKSVKNVVAYYYMWKTTDRYQIQVSSVIHA